MISLICGIFKNDTNELIYKTEIDLPTWKMNLWLPKGKGDGGEFGINSYTLYLKEINKDLLHNTGNYI